METVSTKDIRRKNFHIGMRVLVVDDEEITLKLLEILLRSCKYEVAAVSRPTDALNILHDNQGEFHIVLSDIHMPIMSGFELLTIIKKYFKIPVILMSADDDVDTMTKAMQYGAASFISKPILKSSIENIWQFVHSKYPVRKEIYHQNDQGKVQDNILNNDTIVEDEREYSIPTNIINHNKKDEQGENSKVYGRKEDKKSEYEVTQKKTRMIWTKDLHQKFLAAINELGHERAIPKKILEIMNIDGLTRSHVASHLQKYRYHMKGNNIPTNSLDISYLDNVAHKIGISVDPYHGISQRSSCTNFMTQQGYGTRSFFSKKNIQQQCMSNISNCNHQGSSNTASLGTIGFDDVVNETSSYRSSYVGLQLSNEEGMIGVKQRIVGGGVTSDDGANINDIDELCYGKRSCQDNTICQIFNYDVMNFDEVTQAGFSCSNNDEQIMFYETLQKSSIEEQHRNELQSFTSMTRTCPFDDFNYHLDTDEEYNQVQENAMDGLIVDPKFDTEDFQDDTSYPSQGWIY